MPTSARTPTEAWVDAGLDALATAGVDAVRVEALAKTLGVTKGGFYGHFADRQALLTEMLASWERQSTDDVIELVEQGGGPPAAKARLAGLLTLSDRLLPIDLAIRDWARRDRKVAARLRRVDNRRMEFLRAQFTAMHPRASALDIESRCFLALSMLIGNHLVAASHPSMKRIDVLIAAEDLIES